jgi:cytochrome c oxidase subunit 3
MYRWFTDIITEATFEGHHTFKVQQGLRYGMVLFIVSEIMFFFGFFWAFFHSSLSPAVSIGCIWPPKGIEVIKPFELPFLNTLILLSSGVSITWAHRALLSGNRNSTILALAITVLLGIIFTGCQAFEYYTAPFSINDGIYGSIFYMTTGFHGFHVLVGTIFLLANLWRQTEYHFTRQHHFGFEAGAWYWHFVDVVWIFLFTTLYWWGS